MNTINNSVKTSRSAAAETAAMAQVFTMLLSKIAKVGRQAFLPALLACFVVLALPLTSQTGTAQAFDAPPKDQGHTGSAGDGADDKNPDDPDQASAADPVQIKTGNFMMTMQDAVLDSFALPISLQRTYNNLDATFDGPLGTGWSFSFVMSLVEVMEATGSSDNGELAPTIQLEAEVVLRDDTGATHRFTQGENGSWVSPRARFGTLVKTGGGRFTWTRRDGIAFHFVNGRLERIVDTNGNEISLTYDDRGRITRATNPAGRFVSYAYNAANKVAVVTDNIGRTVAYGYNSDNLLTTVTNQIGNTTTYGYDEERRLNKIVSADGTTVLSNTYDGNGRVTEQSAFGASFSFRYFETYTRVTNAKGSFSDHYFNEFGNPIRRRDLRGNNRYYTWDDNGNKTSETDQRGNKTTFTYTDTGDVASITAPDGGVTRFTYNAIARVTSVTDPLGRVSTMVYDARGNLTSVKNPLNQVETFTYDGAGRILTATSKAGDVTTFSYNAVGDLIAVKDENGLTETITHDAVGRVISATNAAGETSTFAYNGRNRLLSYTDPLGDTTEYAFNVNDEPVAVKDPLGQTMSQQYDGFGRVISDTNGAGNTATFEYDTQANLTRVTGPEGRQTTRIYDRGNLLTRVTRPDGSVVQYAHDRVGNTVRITDPRGNRTDISYDEMDRMNGVRYADGSTTTRTYDLAGRLTTMVDRKGQTFAYAYDDLDRLTKITLPNDGAITYTYDVDGNLLTVTGYEGTVAYSYDPGDRLLSETGVWGDVLNFAYDDANRLTQLIRPDRYNFSYGYDADGRMQQATVPSGTTTYSYDKDDRLITEVMPNGVMATYGYDNADRITQVTHTAPDGETVLTSNSYSYDDSSLITSMTEANGTVHAYSYDGMLRLVSETITPMGGPAKTTSWTYDKNGNRLTQNADGVITTYVNNEVDELTSDSTGAAYSYDENGNLITTELGTEVTSHSYDDLDRMTGLNAHGELPLSYGYNGNGVRVRRTEGPTTTREVRWGSALLEEKDSAGVPGRRYDYTLALSAISGSFGTRYYQFDGIGGTRGLSDSAGALTDSYAFNAHGGEVQQIGSTPNPYVFNGALGYFNENRAGFHHVGARYYSAGIGRFVQTDPVRQGLNAYRHALANPVNFNDPSGEVVPLCVGGAVKGLIEDEVVHQGFGGKEKRTWVDRIISAAVGCVTGGYGNSARSAAKVASRVADSARAADRVSETTRLCRSGRCDICSFDGDTEVVTDQGLVRIEDVNPDEMRVLSKDASTGELSYQSILNHYSNDYDITVRIEIWNPATGSLQTIISNTIHPFFAIPAAGDGSSNELSLNTPLRASHSSEGVVYKGSIAGGAWIDAANLRPGDRLLTAAGTYSEVRSVSLRQEPLKAWNMNVAVSDSYFVAEADEADAVWVHNCNVTKGPDFFRGAKPGQSPDFTPRPNDFKVDKNTGLVKDTHGVSIFDNAQDVSKNGFVPHKVDQSTIPDSLRIIQRGQNKSHFEITPKPGANLTPQEFINACSQIVCK